MLSGCSSYTDLRDDVPLDAWGETLGSSGGSGGEAEPPEPLDTAGAGGGLPDIPAGAAGHAGEPGILEPTSGGGGELPAATAGGRGGAGGAISMVGGGGSAGAGPLECPPSYVDVDGSCVCPPGTMDRYNECVSHCAAANCVGTQYHHDLEPGESLWLSRSEVGCHEVVGYRPTSPGVMISYYGNAQRLSATDWTLVEVEARWYPDGDVSHGFCLRHLSPSDLVVAGDGCTRVDGVLCCSGQCTPS